MRKKSKEIWVHTNFSIGLNAALKNYYYPIPSPEKICAKPNRGNFFQKSTLVTHIFKYQWRKNVLSCSVSTPVVGCTSLDVFHLGVKVAPAIFQQVMDTMLSDLDFTIAYLDNILMNIQNVEQHKEHVHKVFSKIQDYGFKLKESKCDFFMEKIKYLGHIINKDGRRPEPEWATTIKDMPAPENVISFQSFLGLANYYQAFIFDMHNL